MCLRLEYSETRSTCDKYEMSTQYSSTVVGRVRFNRKAFIGSSSTSHDEDDDTAAAAAAAVSVSHSFLLSWLGFELTDNGGCRRFELVAWQWF